MKKSTLLLGLSLLSFSVLAENYNKQVDFNFLNADDFNVINLEGTHYFARVTTNNASWAEAAFMGRNNSYTNFDNAADSLSLGGDYYHEKIFVRINFAFVDIDDSRNEKNLVVDLGYFFAENWLVSAFGWDYSSQRNLRLNF